MRMALTLSWLYLIGCVRRQVHLVTLMIAVLLLALPSYVAAFSLGTNAFERVATDFGLTLISLFGVGMAVGMGSTSLSRDRQSRALYPILARPVRRGGYLAAHLLAVALLLASSMAFLGSCLTLSLALKGGHLPWQVMLAVYAAFLQALVIAAVCLSFSIFCSPALAGTIGTACFLVGNLSGAFIRFFLVEDRDSQGSAWLARTLKGLTPNLSLFNIKDPVVHHLVLPPGYLASISVYAAMWVLLLLTLSRLALQRVDL